MVDSLLWGLELLQGEGLVIVQEGAVGSAFPLEASPQLLVGELVSVLVWALRNGAIAIEQMMRSFDFSCVYIFHF